MILTWNEIGRSAIFGREIGVQVILTYKSDAKSRLEKKQHRKNLLSVVFAASS